MKILRLGMAACLCVLMLANAQAAETGVALKADDIRAEPFGDAKAVAVLALNDKVEILGKNGGWLQIKSAKGKGWVRMLSIRKGDAKKGGNEAAGLLSMSSGRAGTGKVVATTGIRGLGEEELNSAFAEFKKLADRKKEMFDGDIEAIIMNAESGGQGPWEMAELHISAGTGAIAAAAAGMIRIAFELANRLCGFIHISQ